MKIIINELKEDLKDAQEVCGRAELRFLKLLAQFKGKEDQIRKLKALRKQLQRLGDTSYDKMLHQLLLPMKRELWKLAYDLAAHKSSFLKQARRVNSLKSRIGFLENGEHEKYIMATTPIK